MGRVYLGRQVGLNRPVALKLMRSGEGVDAKALIRFLAEAEAVAAIRHPNVVEVYAYGDHQGKPYLALEYCPGGDLTKLTKAEQTRDAGWFRRVAALMAQVADGVNAAHLLGIVHRDLKPHNVLLAADGTPKVADFGLAKRGNSGDLTRTDAILGTPAYMSPEQAGGGTKFVGPESDVWALGVILYELLTGDRPLDAPTPLELVTRVLAGDVPPVRGKCPAVPPDLALITHKCLARDPRDRYHTAGGLAEDLRAWQADKPISARPAGVVEMLVKWARRNPRLAAGVATFAAVLVIGTWVSTWQALRATAEAGRADAEAAEARRLKEEAVANAVEAAEQKRRADEEGTRARVSGELTTFLQSLFTASDPSGLIESGLMPGGQGGAKVTAAELLDRGTALLRQERFQGTDRSTRLTRASLLDALGEASRSIGQLGQAGELVREAVAIRRELLPSDHPDRLASEFHLANWHTERGDLTEAGELYAAVLDALARTNSLDTLTAAGVQLRVCAYCMLTGDDRAEELARAGLATRRRLLTDRHRDTALARLVLAGVHFGESKPLDGLAEMTLALDTLNADGKLANDPAVAAVFDYQAGLLARKSGFPSVAAGKFRTAVDKLKAALGPNHLYVTLFLGELAFALLQAGDRVEAEGAFRECMDVLRKTAGVEFPKAIIAVEQYADLLIDRRAKDEAWALMDEVLRKSAERHGTKVLWRFPLLAAVVRVAVRTGRNKEAAELTDELVTAYLSRPPGRRKSDGVNLANAGRQLTYLPDMAAARKVYAVLFEVKERQADPEGRWSDLHNLGTALARVGRYDEAEEYLRQAVELIPTSGVQKTKDFGVMAYDLASLGEVEWHKGHHAEAEKLFRTAVEYDRRDKTKEGADERLALLTRFVIAHGRPNEARPVVAEFLKLTKLGPADRAWGLFVQAATAEPTADMTKLATAVEAACGRSADPTVAMYRARAVIAAGGDVGREGTRMAALLKDGTAGDGVRVAAAECALVGGKPADAADTLAGIKTRLGDGPRSHLRRLLVAAADHRRHPTEQSLAELRVVVTNAEAYLTSTAKGTDPALSRSDAGDLLTLRGWSDRVKAELKR
jgi:tetratricopeptide (TPR) repeat protein